jgi:hypothetical protein
VSDFGVAAVDASVTSRHVVAGAADQHVIAVAAL